MPRNVLMLGDVHSAFGDVTRAIDHHRKILEAKGKTLDKVIQVGDFGHNYLHARMDPKGFGVPFYFIDGNHDNIPWLQSLEAPYKVAENTYYVPRATHWEGINFLGGAQSIDRSYGREGFNWFPEEIPSDEEYEAFASLPAAAIWVTHTAPVDVVQRVLRNGGKLDPVSQALHKIYADSAHKPKYWFCGHLHKSERVFYGGQTQLSILDCVFTRYNEFNELTSGDQGIILELE